MADEQAGAGDTGGESDDAALSEIVGADVAPAMAGMMSRLVKNATREYREAHEAETSARRVADEESRRTSLNSTARAYAKAFRDEVGDYSPAIEARMVELGKRVVPGEDATPAQYLRHLYTLAKKDVGAAAKAEPKPEAPKPKRQGLREILTGESEEPVKPRRHPLRAALTNEPDGGRRRAKVEDVSPEKSFDESLEDAWGSAFK